MTEFEFAAEKKRREKEFERRYDEHGLCGPLDDDEFLKLAIDVFIGGAFATTEPLSIEQKAARSIAMRFLQVPDDEKNWRVTFPVTNWDKDQILTPKQRQSRARGFEICERVRRGEMVTHAMTQVAAARLISYDTAKKSYYENVDMFVAMLRLYRPDDPGIGNFE
ncbi:hypothetical protein [Paraburkholderia saeva]|uniref:hypothetical protein n=1 Tax=Paraburkholderia saeva TaxID=2777537 RepID=UPI001D704680|nr:hypothetical protein [Paraburkholderia saeva]CAG4925739.1 hypothetical protein R52603_05406 [Paraburkholderia saeva]